MNFDTEVADIFDYHIGFYLTSSKDGVVLAIIVDIQFGQSHERSKKDIKSIFK